MVSGESSGTHIGLIVGPNDHSKEIKHLLYTLRLYTVYTCFICPSSCFQNTHNCFTVVYVMHFGKHFTKHAAQNKLILCSESLILSLFRQKYIDIEILSYRKQLNVLLRRTLQPGAPKTRVIWKSSKRVTTCWWPVMTVGINGIHQDIITYTPTVSLMCDTSGYDTFLCTNTA